MTLAELADQLEAALAAGGPLPLSDAELRALAESMVSLARAIDATRALVLAQAADNLTTLARAADALGIAPAGRPH